MLRSTSSQVGALLDAVRDLDEERLVALLEDGHEGQALESWLDEVVLPFLQGIGDAWESGAISVAHEHFASQVVRTHLATHPHGVPAKGSRVAVLAAPPGELHDIALQSFGLLLRGAGWRIRFLGQDTPMAALVVACRTLSPDLVVVAATRRTAIDAHAPALRRLAESYRIAIAGRGATEDTAGGIGAELLPDEMASALRAVTRRTALTA